MSVAPKPLQEVTKQPDRPKLSDVMGPGLITGASDDDPSGIATYSQAGAQFGYALGWTLLLTYPLMCAIQMISAQIGRVTGRGLAGNMRRYYPAPLLYLLVGLLIVANTINIGADLGAMAAALRLLVECANRDLRRGLCDRHGSARSVHALFALCIGSTLANDLALCLCRNRVRGRHAVGHCGTRSDSAANRAFGQLHNSCGRGLRDDDKPLPILLAGIRGSRGRKRRRGSQAFDQGASASA
jgi:Natural resistance-associated macrophage protein